MDTLAVQYRLRYTASIINHPPQAGKGAGLMGTGKRGVVFSHWSQLIENFQASPKAFYGLIEQAVLQRQVPDTSSSRVDWKEGGILSADREYLRISRGRHFFDICGAPYGTGFFVSWWLNEARSLRGLALFATAFAGLLFASFIALLVLGKIFGVIAGVFLTFLLAGVGIPAGLWATVVLLNRNMPGWDDPIMEIPFVGPVYKVLFRPVTYYRTDTALMFQAAVEASVKEVIQTMTAEKGVRAFSDLQSKPVMRELVDH